ncbi:MAG: Sec-independent protein translocase protein TatB [Congregibacter sp.]
MFDIGFAELLIIGVVGLLVIGPERLPGAIRTGSAWLNRFRRGFNEIKQEVQQELHNDAVMQELKELRDSGDQLRQHTQQIRDELTQDLRSDLSPDLAQDVAKDSANDAAEDPESQSSKAATSVAEPSREPKV